VSVVRNLLANLPADLAAERFETLIHSSAVRIERIVSQGHASPEGFWYDQDEAEWLLVLSGAARLTFENQRPIELGPGDSLDIPAHRRHRVEWTDPTQLTVWLAVFYHAAGSPNGRSAAAV
jgi:cupin 2 domain-containing protein